MRKRTHAMPKSIRPSGLCERACRLSSKISCAHEIARVCRSKYSTAYRCSREVGMPISTYLRLQFSEAGCGSTGSLQSQNGLVRNLAPQSATLSVVTQTSDLG